MQKSDIIAKLVEIGIDIFDNEDVELTETTTADEVEGWDSLTHIQFVVEIEKAFKIRFASREIQGWKNVGEMVDTILSKINE